MQNRFYILAFGALLLCALVMLLVFPEANRMQYAFYVFTIPLAIGTIFVRSFYGMILLMLVSGVWGRRVNVGIAYLYLYQWMIFFSTFGIIIRSIIFRAEHLARDPAGLQKNGVPYIAIGPALAFFASFFMAPNTALAIKNGIYLCMLFCPFYVCLNSCDSWNKIRSALKAMFVGMSAVALIGLFMGGWSFGHVGTPMLRNPNLYGCFLAAPAVLWFYLLMNRISVTGHRLLEILGLCAVILANLLSLSRSSYLGIAAGAFVACALSRRIKFALVIAAFMLVVGVNMVGSTDAFSEKLGEKGSSGIDYRMKKIRMAMDMFAASPVIGVGPGGFEYAAAQDEDEAIRNHTTLESTYPFILAEYGVLGALGWLATYWFCYRAWTRLPKDRHDMRRILGNACLSALVCVSVIQIGENTIFMPKTNWMIGIILGIMFSLRWLPFIAGAGHDEHAPAYGDEFGMPPPAPDASACVI
ncbi:MAG: O-antigen ligase family protein [Planctomycetes bacterium]|nr:O-antigen ligase family protein [Planctomycetota bacterium]